MSVNDYCGASEILGHLRIGQKEVTYKSLISKSERLRILALAVSYTTVAVSFMAYLAMPGHMPTLSGQGFFLAVLSVLGVGCILGIQLIQFLATTSLLIFALRGKLPVPMEPEQNLRIAMLTTIVPSKEPWEQARETLRMFKKQKVREGTKVDAWILDEGDDPRIKLDCQRLGFKHFSRKGVERWNQEEGPFRAKTKHGNHNAWRDLYESDYDIVTQMDPDHKPLETCDFLERITGYFRDPDVAYVVAPQVYGNREDGLVATGAAELAYLFHGVIQPGANGLDAPLLIGTNHAFRPSAWKQIDGYQDNIIEDHLTAMRVATEVNPATGNRWKGVYTPDILTAGEGPNSWSDFFTQQKRWAYGIFEILTTKTPKMWRGLNWKQRFSFLALQYHYPAVSLNWFLGTIVSAIYLVFGVTFQQIDIVGWVIFLFLTNFMSLLAFFWLRRFNLAEHERKSWGLSGMLLNLVTVPVYFQAGFEQLTGRPLTFQVTAKGRLARGDSLMTFRPHMAWAVFAVFAMLAGLLQGHHFPVLYFWMALTLVTCMTPITIWGLQTLRKSGAATPTPVPEVANTNVRLTDAAKLDDRPLDVDSRGSGTGR